LDRDEPEQKREPVFNHLTMRWQPSS
jgi:hypothetical protein